MEIIKPQISIITVVFNGANGIENTILSIVNQTYKNVEYLIIDGGSTDGTIDIIKKYETKISFWVSEPDKGIYDAMNKGVQNAKGDWISFLNSGDIFSNENVIEQIFSNKFNYSALIIYGKTRIKNSSNYTPTPTKVSKGFFFYNTICHQSIFFNSKTFKSIGLFNIKYKIIADREWLIRLTISNVNYTYIDLVVSDWDPDGYSSNNINQYLKEQKELRSQYFNKLEFIKLYFMHYYMWVKLKLINNR